MLFLMRQNVEKECRPVPALLGGVCYDTTCRESRKTYFCTILMVFHMTEKCREIRQTPYCTNGGFSYDTTVEKEDRPIPVLLVVFLM